MTIYLNAKPAAKPEPKIRFTPYAFAKARYFRDMADVEISGYCVTSVAQPLLIQDFCLVKQEVSMASIEMDGNSIGEFYERMVDQGRTLPEFARIWMHTHPGSSASPSGTDEDNFAKHFSQPDWAVMLILAKGGEWYARLRYNLTVTDDVAAIVGRSPHNEKKLSVEIDWDAAFPASDFTAWEEEYVHNVTERKWIQKTTFAKSAKWPLPPQQTTSYPYRVPQAVTGFRQDSPAPAKQSDDLWQGYSERQFEVPDACKVCGSHFVDEQGDCMRGCDALALVDDTSVVKCPACESLEYIDDINPCSRCGWYPSHPDNEYDADLELSLR